MADQSHQLVQKLWNYCNILRDDGLSYGDYVDRKKIVEYLLSFSHPGGSGKDPPNAL
jgi:hypothetical protein